jgi:hypothetical protein
MPSPFPGMNPYLEDPDIWPDFHTTLFVEIRAELNRRLPAGYYARIDRYVWVEEPDDESTSLLGKPDVFVTEELPAESQQAEAGSTVTACIRLVRPAVKHAGNRYLKVIDGRSRRVVTVIEILGPSNKTPGSNQDAYLSKRDEYLGLDINLVEIDLLRKGARPSWGDPPPEPADYSVLAFRASEFPAASYWAISVRDSLPVIAVPLTANLPPVTLSLQACFERAVSAGRYEEEFDYRHPPEPPFAGDDAEWVRERIGKAR